MLVGIIKFKDTFSEMYHFQDLHNQYTFYKIPLLSPIVVFSLPDHLDWSTVVKCDSKRIITLIYHRILIQCVHVRARNF